jgi:hypothetical protein
VILKEPYPPATRGKVIVWGLLASLPVGGMVWQVFHYLVPLRRLGFDVWYVEDSDRPLYDMETFEPTRDPPQENINRLARYLADIGMGERWAYRLPRSETVVGALDWSGLQTLYKEAIAAINLCGAQDLTDRHLHVPNRIYMQTDPVGMQVKVAQGDPVAIATLDKHNWYFTYGASIGQPDCRVPFRYPWKPTLPPVCLDFWGEVNGPRADGKMSTVLNWKHDDRNVTWNGQIWHWSKDREFRRFFDLPSRAALPLELCLGGASDSERDEIASHGWGLKRSTDYMDPAVYRDYIQGSLGEFSAAKELVVVSRSGWVSDRTVCYLAAGRPAVVQDTGIGSFLPLGEGLFTFSSTEEAVEAIDKIAKDYERHSAGAKRIAREHFDAERVVGDVMRTVGLL